MEGWEGRIEGRKERRKKRKKQRRKEMREGGRKERRVDGHARKKSLFLVSDGLISVW